MVKSSITQSDRIADTYDSLFIDESSLAENTEVGEMLLPLRGTVLDIGCGTGLLTEITNIAPSNYMGVDPSEKMLRIFKRKHPAYTNILCAAYDGYVVDCNKYDNVIALFGAASYLEYKALIRLAMSGSRKFLMFYKDTYHPITYEKCHVEFEHFHHPKKLLLAMEQKIKLTKNIVEVEIGKIIPHDGSHKTDANMNLLVQSIKDFGVNQPITVDKNFVVVTGNGVYKAALLAGITKLPCIILDDLSDEQIAQYRIADDKTQEFATWNEKKLRQELSYLQDPTSMQMYFDESIVGMLGLDAKIKKAPIVSTQQTETADIVNAMTKAEKDRKFKDELNNVNDSMNVRPAEYFEYHCTNCGRLVKVKVN